MISSFWYLQRASVMVSKFHINKIFLVSLIVVFHITNSTNWTFFHAALLQLFAAIEYIVYVYSKTKWPIWKLFKLSLSSNQNFNKVEEFAKVVIKLISNDFPTFNYVPWDNLSLQNGYDRFSIRGRTTVRLGRTDYEPGCCGIRRNGDSAGN